MQVRFYMDVHVPRAITEQLRRVNVDVLTAAEDGLQNAPDTELLERATQLERVLFTQDRGFKTLAEEWQDQQREFAGLLFGHQLGGTIGQFVRDLRLIADASEMEEWRGIVEDLPFR